MTRKHCGWLLFSLCLLVVGGCRSNNVCCCDSPMSFKVGGDFSEAPCCDGVAP